jgi:hypothetical protein
MPETIKFIDLIPVKYKSSVFYTRTYKGIEFPFRDIGEWEGHYANSILWTMWEGGLRREYHALADTLDEYVEKYGPMYGPGMDCPYEVWVPELFPLPDVPKKKTKRLNVYMITELQGSPEDTKKIVIVVAKTKKKAVHFACQSGTAEYAEFDRSKMYVIKLGKAYRSQTKPSILYC